MRDIKFRGKSLLNNAWIVGYLIIDNISDKYYILPNGNSCNESDKMGEEGLLHIFTFEVDKETIGQYTGLKDKNGKEIYEGDIVKVKLYKGEEEKYFIGKVEYFGSNFIVDADNNSEYHIYDLDGFGIDYRYKLEDCEVIGNIYDNPELLEEGE